MRLWSFRRYGQTVRRGAGECEKSGQKEIAVYADVVQEISFAQKRRQEEIVVDGPVGGGVGNGRLGRHGSDNRIDRPHEHQQTASGDCGRFVRPSRARDWSAAREACAFRAPGVVRVSSVDRVPAAAAAQTQSVDRRTATARYRGNVAHQQRPSGRLQPVHPMVREVDHHKELVTGAAVRRTAVVLTDVTSVTGPCFIIVSSAFASVRASRVIRFVI